MKQAADLISAPGTTGAAKPAQAPGSEARHPEQADEIPLYAAAQPTGEPEQWDTRTGNRMVRNVVSPTLTPVLPDPAKTTGAAVIVAPGGGFKLLAIDHEGYKAAHWLADRGVAAFVLKYRLRPTPREGLKPALGPPASGAAGEPAKYSGRPDDIGDAIQDVRTAVELVCSRAAEWGVDPARVGLLGFSAGAVLALEVGLGTENGGRPGFVAAIYGPLASRPVPEDAPPLFAVLASDDPIMGPGGFDLVSRYREANKPVEFHLYEKGGHAFGMRQQGTTSDLWIEEFYAWMKERELLGLTPQ